MKKFVIIFIIAFIGNRVSAQILHPVKWSYAAKKITDTEAVIFLKATIEDGWHIYSVNQPDGGPIKTSFEFSSSKDYVLIGKIAEPKLVTTHDKTFDMDVSYFEHSVVFQQKVKLKSPGPLIKGKLNFMVCNSQKCLPPEEVEFTIPVK